MTFLDRSFERRRGEGMPSSTDMGQGALREVLRKELSESPYVSYFRPGTQHEGGDGVTVVWLT